LQVKKLPRAQVRFGRDLQAAAGMAIILKIDGEPATPEHFPASLSQGFRMIVARADAIAVKLGIGTGW